MWMNIGTHVYFLIHIFIRECFVDIHWSFSVCIVVSSVDTRGFTVVLNKSASDFTLELIHLALHLCLTQVFETHLFLCIWLFDVCLSLCVFACVCLCTCAHKYIYINIHTHVNIFKYMYYISSQIFRANMATISWGTIRWTDRQTHICTTTHLWCSDHEHHPTFMSQNHNLVKMLIGKLVVREVVSVRHMLAHPHTHTHTHHTHTHKITHARTHS